MSNLSSNHLKCLNCKSRQYSVFNNVDSETLNSLSKSKVLYTYSKKEVIFNKDDKVDGFYCIKDGLVRTLRNSKIGREQTFDLANAGKWVGFRDMITNESFTNTAISLEETEVCFISKESYENLLKDSYSFQREMTIYLANEWKKSEDKVYSLGLKQTHERLAELLLTFSSFSEKEDQIELKLTREVMASCIGTNTETLIRALSDFKDRNWIGIEKNKILILDKKSLTELSEKTLSSSKNKFISKDL